MLFPARKAATTALVTKQHRGLHISFTSSRKSLHSYYTRSTTVGARSLSTAPPPVSGSSGERKSFNPFSGMWDNYQDNKTKKEFRNQMEEVAAIKKWNLAAYHEQLAKTAKSWKASVPGLSSMAEVKSSKDGFEIVDRIMLELGKNADVEDLHALTELQKLKIANESNLTVERLNNEIRNFEASAQTHRLITLLKKKRKDVPDTPDEMRQLLMANAKVIMTKQEKARMTEIMRKSQMSQMKRRRL